MTDKAPEQSQPWVIFIVLALLIAGAFLMWRPGSGGDGPAPSTPAAGSPTRVVQGNIPPEVEGPLDWPWIAAGIIRMSQDPRLAISKDQAGTLLQQVERLEQDLKPFFQFEVAAFTILTPEQLAFIEENPEVPQTVIDQAKGGLMDTVLASVEERSKASAFRMPLAYITPKPTTSPEKVSSMRIRARELLWGILMMNQQSRLALTPEQANKLLPWLQPLKSDWDKAKADYEAMRSTLNREQLQFLESEASVAPADLNLPAPPPGQDALIVEVKRICAQQAKSS